MCYLGGPGIAPSFELVGRHDEAGPTCTKPFLSRLRYTGVLQALKSLLVGVSSDVTLQCMGDIGAVLSALACAVV